MNRNISRRLSLFISCLSLLPYLQPAEGQEVVVPLLRGEARLGDGPFRGGFVVLHRVSSEASGEIDSVRVEEDGSFVLHLPHVPDHATRPEIFFASVQHGGLHYFGPAITEAVQLDSLYLIQAFDTLSVPRGGAQVPLGARNLYLEQAEGGWMATDVFLLLNEGDRTLFSPEEGVVWSYPLPSSATEFEAAQADLAPEVVQYSEGRMELFSPLPPGERNIIVRYRIAERDFVLPMPGRTDRMEILMREPGPEAEFPPLSLSDPMEMDPGIVFRRYSADSLRNMEIVSHVAPEPRALPGELLALLVAASLAAAGVFGYRKRATVPPGPPKAREYAGSERNRLLLAIARLDEEFQDIEDVSGPSRIEYESERERLLSELKSLS